MMSQTVGGGGVAYLVHGVHVDGMAPEAVMDGHKGKASPGKGTRGARNVTVGLNLHLAAGNPPPPHADATGS